MLDTTYLQRKSFRPLLYTDQNVYFSGGSRISQTGAPTPQFSAKTYYLARFLLLTAWKWNKLCGNTIWLVASCFRFGGGVDPQYSHHSLIGCFMFQVWGRCGPTVWLVASCFRFWGGVDAQHRHSSLIGCFMFQVWGGVGTAQTQQSDWLLHVSGLVEVWTHSTDATIWLVASCFRFWGGVDAQYSLTGCFMFQVWGRCGHTVQTPQSD